MIISYEEALSIAQKELLAKDNLSHFCKHIGIDYNYALKIKNGNADKPYPEIVARILEYLGYEVTKMLYFKLDKSYGNNDDTKKKANTN